MAKNNPMVGGPDYARWLAQSVNPQKLQNLAHSPPATGGAQISIRLRADRLRLFDTLSARSGWNRNQVIESLLDCGLATFFHHVDDVTAEDLMEAALPESLRVPVSFPNQTPVSTPRKTLAFPAVVRGETVECEITSEALRDHFGAPTIQSRDLIVAFISGKEAIHAVAKTKVPTAAGRCLLVSSDF